MNAFILDLFSLSPDGLADLFKTESWWRKNF